MYKHFFKRFLDFTLSLTGLIVLSPVFIAITTLLFFTNRGKPFFRQARPGRHEKIFKIIKFKTMNDKKDAAGRLLPDGERLTAIGKFIRKTSLDELPQLLNVLKGEMSLVGPRPLLVEYLPLYNARQRRRHDARPGITGWAQVNGRNFILLSQKFECDVWYVDHVSFKLDMRILYMTVCNVSRGKDIGTGSEYIERIDDLKFSKK
jgi:lipopolysaccharide/colanic/teichoic acid biosynthesis glycosyltransferase